MPCQEVLRITLWLAKLGNFFFLDDSHVFMTLLSPSVSHQKSLKMQKVCLLEFGGSEERGARKAASHSAASLGRRTLIGNRVAAPFWKRTKQLESPLHVTRGWTAREWAWNQRGEMRASPGQTDRHIHTPYLGLFSLGVLFSQKP